MPFVVLCCPAIEVAFAAWQVRVDVWPSPTVNDLHVLHLAKAAISVMAIISQPHCSCSPIVPRSSSLSFPLFPLSLPQVTVKLVLLNVSVLRMIYEFTGMVSHTRPIYIARSGLT